MEGRSHPLLAGMVADFYLDQMHLPSNWSVLIQDEAFAGQVVRRMLAGNYSVQRGRHVERIVRDRLDVALQGRGLGYEKGRVWHLAKEIDVAVPDTQDPSVMIMVSYMETTSSGQDQRATEQEAMFQDIERLNRLNRTNKAFINVVDGGGWLARSKALEEMYVNSHYCLSINMLDQFDEIVAHHA